MYLKCSKLLTALWYKKKRLSASLRQVKLEKFSCYRQVSEIDLKQLTVSLALRELLNNLDIGSYIGWLENLPIAIFKKIITNICTTDLGPVSRKPKNLFGPLKTLLVHLYLKCIRRNFLYERNHWDIAMAFWDRNVSGTFEKRTPGAPFVIVSITLRTRRHIFKFKSKEVLELSLARKAVRSISFLNIFIVWISKQLRSRSYVTANKRQLFGTGMCNYRDVPERGRYSESYLF